MAKRSELKSVANGFLGNFCSRNNDIDGYWALGLFYQYVLHSQDNIFEFDLIEARKDQAFNRNLDCYRNAFEKRLIRLGFTKSFIVKAGVKITFEKAPINSTYINVDLRPFSRSLKEATPYICEVYIVSDLQKKYVVRAAGYCWPHDPQREARSARISDL
ncbi:MAG: hypothetical protein HWE34_06870 [Methylocystaceae bacterium]|nr:hypothetical protein [Methylocystaceae bacterium]